MNVTCLLLELLGVTMRRAENDAIGAALKKLIHDEDDVSELYCALFLYIDHAFVSQNATYMQYNQVQAEVKKHAQTTVASYLAQQQSVDPTAFREALFNAQPEAGCVLQ
eukprot:TRINITY_DN1899_c0_g1_i1.p2 TRINITY_DN1899_c0_g1~~TRINITY_DN1899_c0_g1_i1.p2  ORF type:complete len:109 (+),score=30.08 TRINITY_DN1899_c0_g1_i1:643-969(+)